MNKFQRELLENCSKETEIMFTNKPLFDEILVINTDIKHESGYNRMHIIGAKGGEYYYLSGICDILEFNCNGKIMIDLKNGITRYFARDGKFKTIYSNSCCEFEVVEE